MAKDARSPPRFYRGGQKKRTKNSNVTVIYIFYFWQMCFHDKEKAYFNVIIISHPSPYSTSYPNKWLKVLISNGSKTATPRCLVGYGLAIPFKSIFTHCSPINLTTGLQFPLKDVSQCFQRKEPQKVSEPPGFFVGFVSWILFYLPAYHIRATIFF